MVTLLYFKKAQSVVLNIIKNSLQRKNANITHSNSKCWQATNFSKQSHSEDKHCYITYLKKANS